MCHFFLGLVAAVNPSRFEGSIYITDMKVRSKALSLLSSLLFQGAVEDFPREGLKI